MSESERKQRELGQAVAPGKARLLLADGLRWIVREVPAPQFDRRGGTHLVFDGELVMRRVRNFPADWYTLSDEALYALSQQIQR